VSNSQTWNKKTIGHEDTNGTTKNKYGGEKIYTHKNTRIPTERRELSTARPVSIVERDENILYKREKDWERLMHGYTWVSVFLHRENKKQMLGYCQNVDRQSRETE
jgi:hypothetical protein